VASQRKRGPVAFRPRLSAGLALFVRSKSTLVHSDCHGAARQKGPRVGGEYASETSRIGCFTHDLGKFVPEFKRA